MRLRSFRATGPVTDRALRQRSSVRSTRTSVQPENQEIRELTDSLVRLQAEFDNYRKRQAREFRRLSSQGKRELITELLDVLDNFDRAENHRSVDDQSPEEISEGLFKTVDQMRRILSQFGLRHWTSG